MGRFSLAYLFRVLRIGFILGMVVGMSRLDAADPFAENVRTAPWLSPQEEQKQFQLPPGFEIQLVAAEPDILKPMNLAFDCRGRLWVTVTEEYPFAAPLDRPGRDAIKVLEDKDGDGRAEVVTTFADGLNIPIGLYPYRNGVIAWSIPNLWFFEDTDGDGRSDRRTKVFGPLGYERDTHGMNASLRRGFDGWIYATHGYNNESTYRATDGGNIQLQSGNTYRFLPDGSRVAQHTWGQVNPFGLCWDSGGNLFSADCHSSPLYQLLAGGYYPSFGKPHDGLGFAPEMMRHSHGSTALCGVSIYEDDLWPEEFRGNAVVGNVMTSRVNRDRLSKTGASYEAVEMPDFIATKDPWFRPVDLQLGPDGAMYVADFYNRIIGHYEVPLKHPGRDRTSGRIWRVVYRGADGTLRVRPRRDLSKASGELLIEALKDPNLAFRLLAMQELGDRVGVAAVPGLQSLWREGTAASGLQKAHAVWLLHRLGGLKPEILQAAAKDTASVVRVHAMRVLAQLSEWRGAEREWAVGGLTDSEALVRRCAAEALAAHPAIENIAPLVELRAGVKAGDTHLLYVARKALRDQLRSGDVFARWLRETRPATEQEAVADVALAVRTPESAAFVMDYVSQRGMDRSRLTELLRHAARYLPESGMGKLASYARREFAGQVDFQLDLLQSIQSGLGERGIEIAAELRDWAAYLAESLLVAGEDSRMEWVHRPVEDGNDLDNPWALQRRDSADGVKGRWFYCTLPPGEQRTGALRSRPFRIPSKLEFFLAGHDGFPDKPLQGKNLIRLADAGSGTVLAQTPAPRNDLAQKITWRLEAHAGKTGVVEVIDSDTAGAYAWLAVGRFDPPVIGVSEPGVALLARRQVAAAQLASQLKMTGLEPRMRTLFSEAMTGPAVRVALARALSELHASGCMEELAKVLTNAREPSAVREQVAKALATPPETASLELIAETMRTVPQRLQVRLAGILASSAAGAEVLLRRVEAGQLPAALLVERGVKEKILAGQVPGNAVRLDRLTKNLAPPSEGVQKLIADRVRGFHASTAAIRDGEGMYDRTCAVCHQVNGRGGLVGPQLDGIGNRGLERVVEDILDPNRNVDHAFRTSLLTMADGEIVSGLIRREEGELVILANSAGQEFSVRKIDIQKRDVSETSLMPSNFGELLTAQEFDGLVGFLLSLRPDR